MMEELGKQQEVHLKKKMAHDVADARRKARFMAKLKADAYIGGFFVFLIIFTGCMMAVIAHDAEVRHPEWKSNRAQATLEIIRRQEISRVLEEANTRSDIRYRQLKDASSSNMKIDNSERNSSGD